MKRKKNKWVKPRHKVVTRILGLMLIPYCKIKYGITIKPFKEQRGRQFLIIMNHQTAFDQFFVGATFKGAVYYIASEDIFSIGFVSKLIKFLVAPIPIKKQTTDVTAVRTCLRVAREGGTIALAPEGNRTYGGRPVNINPAIAGLVKALRLPVAIMHIEGGYGVHPRWSDVVRKGKMTSFVSKVIEPEEYKNLSDEELFETIKEAMWVDETKIEGNYRHKRNAEFLERAIYVCPNCGLSTFKSNNDIIECLKCHKKIRHCDNKKLEGVGFDFPFTYVADWYDYQCDFVNKLELNKNADNLFYEDTVSFFEVILYKRKQKIFKDSKLSLYGNRIEVISGDIKKEYYFDKIKAMSVLGKNKLNIYFEDKVYQVKGDKRFNALKYLNFYYRFKNILGGKENGKFLGL